MKQDNLYSVFKLNSSDLGTSFEASSMQEAATKFGYGLFHFNQLNSKTKEKPYIFQCENVNSGEKLEYQAFLILKGTIKTPLIVTRRIAKKCRNDLMNYQIDSDVFENSEEDLTASNSYNTLEHDHDIGSNLDEVLVHTLINYFGYPSFRPLQKDIIKATMTGRNVLGILGTGSGKYLLHSCFLQYCQSILLWLLYLPSL